MSNKQKLTETEDILQFKAMVNELYTIYKEWLEIFPFELEMFKHLKEEFTKELPIVKETKWTLNDRVNEIEVDIYSNKTFHQFLSQKTMSILSQINTLTLFENGEIDDIGKHKLDIVIRERRLKLKDQVTRSRYQKPEYIDYINEWFNDEKQFIEDIKEESLRTTNEKVKSKSSYLYEHLSKHGFYDSRIKTK